MHGTDEPRIPTDAARARVLPRGRSTLTDDIEQQLAGGALAARGGAARLTDGGIGVAGRGGRSSEDEPNVIDDRGPRGHVQWPHHRRENHHPRARCSGAAALLQSTPARVGMLQHLQRPRAGRGMSAPRRGGRSGQAMPGRGLVFTYACGCVYCVCVCECSARRRASQAWLECSKHRVCLLPHGCRSIQYLWVARILSSTVRRPGDPMDESWRM